MMERAKAKRPRTSAPADATAEESNPISAGGAPVRVPEPDPFTVASRLRQPELLHATVAQSTARSSICSAHVSELRTIPAAHGPANPQPLNLQGSLAQQQMPPPRVDACRPQSAASAASEAPQHEVQPLANPAQSVAAEFCIIPPGHDMPRHPVIPKMPGFQASVAQQQTGQPQPPQVTLAQSTGSSPTAVAPRVPGAHAGPAPLWQATLPPQPEGATPPQPAPSEGQLQQAAALSPSAIETEMLPLQGPELLAALEEALFSNETTPSVLTPHQEEQPRDAKNLCIICRLPEPSMDGDGKPEGTECVCPRCLICKELLLEDGEGVETLPCMHALHTLCLDRWCKSSRKARADCCPLKCGRVTNSFFSLATSSQVSQGGLRGSLTRRVATGDAGLTVDSDSD